MGSTGSDPRPDQSQDGTKYPNPGESPSHPAEGGVGTGTKTDPAKHSPDAPHATPEPAKK